MSDTPRTDAEWTDDYYCSGYVPEEFARQLERELAAAISSIDEERERAQREGARVIELQVELDEAKRKYMDLSMSVESCYCRRD